MNIDNKYTYIHMYICISLHLQNGFFFYIQTWFFMIVVNLKTDVSFEIKSVGTEFHE